jgi:glycosyltransferase involved in cell wall biosynthesis
MYIGAILAEYCRHFPRTTIFCKPEMLAKNRRHLPLSPALHVRTLIVRRASADGDYERTLELPSPSLVTHLLRCRPDLLVLYDYSRVTWLGAFVARLMPRCRVLLLVEADPAFRGVQHTGIQLRIRRIIARQADVIMTNNRRGEEYVEGVLGADPAKVIVKPYLTSQPAAGESGDPAGKPTATGPDGLVTFVFVNSITHRKGLDYLVRAVGALDEARRKRVHVRVVGDGPQRADVERLATELGVTAHFTFVGYVPYDAVASHYREADVFVSPTLRDYRSLTGFEALSFGLPILTSVHDGASEEVVEEGVNGFIVDPRDVTQFADRIGRFVDAGADLATMQIASRRIAGRFSIAQVVANLVEASNRALAARS